MNLATDPLGAVSESLSHSPYLAKQLLDAYTRPAVQQPEWPDAGEAETVRRELAASPTVTTPSDVDRLAAGLADVANGNGFLLQGGDCAETFDDTADHVRANIRTLMQMAVVLTHGAGLPVVTVARMAGQYAKPRSVSHNANGLPEYRGDIVHSRLPRPASRTPDPRRMLRAYAQSRTTMAVVQGREGAIRGSDLHARNRRLLRLGTGGERHDAAAAVIDGRMRATGAEQDHRPEVFVSHEALLLDYEHAMVRLDDSAGDPRLYGLSGHFLWIGERTRQLDGAHVALARLLANPVGLKIGPSTTPEQAVQYVQRLDPDQTPGRLTLISRMGADNVRRVLPGIIDAVTTSGHRVIWQCDPMHGNTIVSPNGLKTRRFDRVVDELRGFFEAHRWLGTHPGGIHLELTGDDVTECLGGPQDITDADLATRYETACDPRLNERQSVEAAFLVAEMLSGHGI